MKTYWGSGSIALLILDLGITWRWVISFTLRPLYPLTIHNYSRCKLNGKFHHFLYKLHCYCLQIRYSSIITLSLKRQHREQKCRVCYTTRIHEVISRRLRRWACRTKVHPMVLTRTDHFPNRSSSRKLHYEISAFKLHFYFEWNRRTAKFPAFQYVFIRTFQTSENPADVIQELRVN